MKNWQIAAGLVAVLGGGVGALFGFDVARGFHMGTVGAYFPDDKQVVLVRPVDLPVLRGRTIDLWWVDLASGKVTQTAREQTSMSRDLEYAGVAADRVWLYSRYSSSLQGVVHRGARATNDRFDFESKLKAHPTLGPRAEYVGLGTSGPVVKDQRGASFLVQTDGTFKQLDMMGALNVDRRSHFDSQRYDLVTAASVGAKSPSLNQLPLVSAGFPLDPRGAPILPREGGGYLVVGEELKRGGDDTIKHVILRIDDNGAVRWQHKLSDAVEDTSVDDFVFGGYVGARLRGLHTTNQRVWAVYEVYTKGKNGTNRETRILEIEAPTGKKLQTRTIVAP